MHGPTFTTPAAATRWLRAHVTGTLHTDSRHVRAGDGFIAWPGAAADGRAYVGAAFAQGAAACESQSVILSIAVGSSNLR